MEIQPRLSVRCFVPALLGPALLAYFLMAYPVFPAGADPGTWLTNVGKGFAIVTEVSNMTPYAGEQFTVAYRLRAARPPVAVDIDPQQFTGFWTEPTGSAEPAAATQGHAPSESEYLLREIIAYPLLSGELKLPALRLKIKAAGVPSRSDEDWDLICLSEPVSIRVLPLPNERDSLIPLVGSLEGRFLSDEPSRGEALLELQGTSNLALFDPARWIRVADPIAIVVRPVDDEKMVQTIEIGGKRRIRLLQRRRWSLRPAVPRNQDTRVDGFRVELFTPENGKWSTKTIAGIRIPGVRTGGMPLEDPAVPQFSGGKRGWKPLVGIVLCALGVLAWLSTGGGQVRLRSLRTRMLSRISRIRFSRP
jgi:hypothetical protein